MARQLKRWGRQWDASHQADPAGVRTRRTTASSSGSPSACPPTGSPASSTATSGSTTRSYACGRSREIAAVVDWEMSTLGDPLSDLGLTLMYWADAGDADRGAGHGRVDRHQRAAGFSPAGSSPARYAELTGYDLADLDFYVAFGCFKLAVILEGIHARFLQKATVGEGFEQVGAQVPVLIDRAHRVLDEGAV